MTNHEWWARITHHCARPELGDFWVSSPKFFSAREGGCSHFWGPKAPKSWLLSAEGARFKKNYFELIIDKKCSKNELRGPSWYFLNFSTKNDLFDRTILFLAVRKPRITNIKLKIAIKLKNTGFYGDFRRFEATH